MIEALGKDVSEVLKAFPKLVQQNVTQVAVSVELAFSEHWKRLVVRAR